MGTNRIRVDLPYRLLTPPKEGMRKEISNVVKLTRSVGKISISCDQCGMEYETYAAWAKRYNRHFCSMACKQASMIERVETKCVVCGCGFYVQPNQKNIAKTCSGECEHIHRSSITKTRHKQNEFPKRVGENSSNSKLKEQDIRTIRQDKRRHVDIAKDFGVSRRLIGMVKRKEIWSHVE